MGFLQSIASFFKGPPVLTEESNAFARQGALWARLALRLSLASGIVSIFAYTFTQGGRASYLHTAGLGLLLLCASFLVGATLGFLFGIPRKLQQTPAPTPQKSSPEGGAGEEEDTPEDKSKDKPKEGSQAGYESNTSLEQISDWLTKILVGLTLTQWSGIRDGFQKMIQYMAPAFGAGSEVFVGGTVILGSLCGFFFGYLPTRLFLWLALTESDRKGAGLYETRKDKNVQEAESLRSRTGGRPAIESARGVEEPDAQSAQDPEARKKTTDLAQKYDTLRNGLKSGTDRTLKMEAILSDMRKLAPQLTEETRAAFQASGLPGEKLAAVAWLQVYPRAGELQWLAERLGSEKPFLGYHAALALLTAARDSNIDANQALAAVKKAQAFLEPSEAGSDRARVLAQAEREAKARM